MCDFVNTIFLPLPPRPPVPKMVLPKTWSHYPGEMNFSETAPPGTVISFAGDISSPSLPDENKTDVIPHGWLLCDGRELYASEFPALFQALGYRYGGEKGKFQIPDYSGYFLRGVDSKEKIDKDKRTNPKGQADRSVGSIQEDAFQDHRHKYKSDENSTAPSDEAGSITGSDIPTTYVYQEAGIKTSKNESRPVNIYVYFIIKW